MQLIVAPAHQQVGLLASQIVAVCLSWALSLPMVAASGSQPSAQEQIDQLEKLAHQMEQVARTLPDSEDGRLGRNKRFMESIYLDLQALRLSFKVADQLEELRKRDERNPSTSNTDMRDNLIRMAANSVGAMSKVMSKSIESLKRRELPTEELITRQKNSITDLEKIIAQGDAYLRRTEVPAYIRRPEQ
jgi:hypothetical protein